MEMKTCLDIKHGGRTG